MVLQLFTFGSGRHISNIRGLCDSVQSSIKYLSRLVNYHGRLLIFNTKHKIDLKFQHRYFGLNYNV